MKKLLTSESVCEGHPDKLCDKIADTILDEYLKQDENSRVACEVAAGKNIIFITGEITSKAKVDIEKTTRKVIKEIGYQEEDINYKTCKIIENISKQSEDINLGTNDKTGGAGDQGLMFGFACDETEELLPLGQVLVNNLAKKLDEVRKKGIIQDIGPDGKTQITVEYNEKDEVERIDTIVISKQHRKEKDLGELKKEIQKEVIEKVIPKKYIDKKTKIYINPTGRFIVGGPMGDSGLTGRKIIVDTYGGYARHGGGSFSGKDGTKVDRSATYMARHIAKNIVANHLAKKCEIQLSYVIGKKENIAIYINTYQTNAIKEEEIIKIIEKNFDLTPQGIIKYLKLKNPIYKKTTNYGHFGKKELEWEKIIKLQI